MGKSGRKPGKKLERKPDPPSQTTPSDMHCSIKHMHTDHNWKDDQNMWFRCPGIWPH